MWVALRAGKPHSMILWGPPGVGKTTLARLMAQHFNAEFITISAVLEDGNLMLRVVDAGVGVAPADAERIFERFITLRDDVRTGSHGLGLAFCRLAAEAHGGAIWVKPGQATGATFCVRIPQPAVPA